MQIWKMLISTLVLQSLFLTVDPPKVVQHPQNQSIIPGKDIDFSIEATGGNLQFQWQKDGSDLSDGDKYYGVHTDRLHIIMVEEGDKGRYRCLVMNKVETKFSHEALLTESKLVSSCYP